MPELLRGANLAGLADIVRAAGQDPVRLAREAGVPPAALTDPDLKISIRGALALLERAAAVAGVPDLGLRMAETRRLSSLGLLGLLVRDQPTVRKALEAAREYLWLHNEAVSLAIDESDGQVIVRVEIATGGLPARQAIELAVGALFARLRALLPAGWRPAGVMFRHRAPADVSGHLRLFGVMPAFESLCDGVALCPRDLDTPIARADPEMVREVQRHVDELARGRTRAVRDRVEAVIMKLLPQGTCTADRVAAHIGCDRRTLHRRLAAEGCSFRGLLDTRRRDMAVSLIDGGRDFTAIADLLGFSSASAFSHWFQRQFGQSPRAYRETGRGAA